MAKWQTYTVKMCLQDTALVQWRIWKAGVVQITQSHPKPQKLKNAMQTNRDL